MRNWVVENSKPFNNFTADLNLTLNYDCRWYDSLSVGVAIVFGVGGTDGSDFNWEES